MLGHVCMENVLKNDFPTIRLLFFCELGHHVAVVVHVVQQEEERSGMVLLQNRLVVVKDGQLCFTFHLESVVGPWVIHVVGSSREQREEDVVVCHLAQLFDTATLEEVD